MAAHKISKLVSQLIDHFICENKASRNKENELFEDCLVKDFCESLCNQSDIWQIDTSLINENDSVVESIESIARQLKSVKNHVAAESLLDCLKSLSDDKEHMQENVQVCQQFLTALSKVNEAENTSCDNEYFYPDTEERPLHRGAVWYDSKFPSPPGVLHMYSNDLFELEDPFSDRGVRNHSLDTSHHGLEIWTRGMYRDLQLMTSKSPGFEEPHPLWYSNSNDSSQIGSEYGSWNTPSDEEGYLDFSILPSVHGLECTVEPNVNSLYMILHESKNYCSEFGEGLVENSLKYENSAFHMDATGDYFVEHQFCEPAILLRAQDIIQLVMGLSSDSFHIVKSGRFLNVFNRDDEESSLGNSLLTDFISMGLYFIRLWEFLQEPSTGLNCQGSVHVALKCGISEYLLCYETTVSSTLVKEIEHIEVLNHHFKELGENLRCVSKLCGFEDPNLERVDMPIGADLIDRLYEITSAAGSGHIYLTLMFLIKHAFAPYFRFLQLWLFEGIYDDSLEEFRLQKSFFFEEARDETYWTSCYTFTSKDRFSPRFLQDMDMDILICGKSFNLLKRCCPTHLLFSVDLPPPSFELAFTENTIQCVREKCRLAMLARINGMLENLAKRQLNSFDENLNAIEFPSAAVNENLCLSLLKFKSQIEQTLGNTSSEEKQISQQTHKSMEDATVSANIPCFNFSKSKQAKERHYLQSNPSAHVKKSKSYELIPSDTFVTFYNGTHHRRRKSWPQSNCTRNSESSKPVTEISSIDDTPFLEEKCSFQIPAFNALKIEPETPHPGTADPSFSRSFYSEICATSTTEKEIVTAEENRSSEKALDRLVQQLTKQLLDCDGDGSQRLFYRQHLSSLIKLSLHSIMKAQIDLVNRCVLNYFFDVLKINNHFFALKTFFGLQDGEFGDYLCRQLYNIANASGSSSDVFNAAKLHSVLMEALANSAKSEMANSALLNFQIDDVPHEVPENMMDILEFVILDYEVEWPCNIIITDLQLLAYNRILAFLLHIQHVMSILKDMWHYFKKLNVENPEIALSSQFRTLQLYRHEMQHFVKAFKSYVGSEVLHFSWDEFQTTILEQITNLEDLRMAHSSYVTTLLEMCLLNPHSEKILTIFKDVLGSVLQFHNILIHSPWQYNSDSHQWECEPYNNLKNKFELFQKKSVIFYKAIVELCQLKFQTCLERLLLTVDFNRYYKRAS